MAKSNLKLQEEVLQMLLDNLEEEGILENRGDHSKQCFYLKESIEIYTKRRQKATEIIDWREDDTQGRPTLEMLTPLSNRNISGDIKELEDFFDRQVHAWNLRTIKRITTVFMFVSNYFLVRRSK